MTKIIQGSKYSTETASLIGEWKSSEGQSSFRWCREELYRTRAGKYFLYGEGYAASPYASRCSDGSYGAGERIVPMSLEQAQAWAEDKLSAEQYEAEWGSPDEDAEKVRIGALIDAQAEAKLRELQRGTGKSIGDIIGDAIMALYDMTIIS